MKTKKTQIIKTTFKVIAVAVVLFFTNCSTNSKEENRRYGFFFFEDGNLYYNSEVYFNFLNLKPDYVFDSDFGEIGIYKCGDLYGYINVYNNGITIPAIKFEHAWHFDSEFDIAAVVENGKMGFINKKGDYLLEPTFPYNNEKYIGQPFGFSDGYCVVPSAQGKAGLIDTTFNLVVDTIYDWVSPESNYFKIYHNDKVGLLFSDFTVFIPCKYDYIEILDCGIIVNDYMSDFMCKLLDFDGRTILVNNVATNYDEIYYDENYYEMETDTTKSIRYAQFYCDGCVGVVDKITGRVISSAKWDLVYMLSENVFIVCEDSYMFLIDINGNFINL
ncbi:MAG: WG repeat-containing protein [Bacteroidales bacterium]|nr:WG repeat-containing protein [Bacteroidales bacterium]